MNNETQIAFFKIVRVDSAKTLMPEDVSDVHRETMTFPYVREDFKYPLYLGFTKTNVFYFDFPFDALFDDRLETANRPRVFYRDYVRHLASIESFNQSPRHAAPALTSMCKGPSKTIFETK